MYVHVCMNINALTGHPVHSRGELPVAHPSLVSHPLFISTMEVQVRQTNDLGESAGQENAFYVKEMT